MSGIRRMVARPMADCGFGTVGSCGKLTREPPSFRSQFQPAESHQTLRYLADSQAGYG
jgi:hypothetical protein